LVVPTKEQLIGEMQRYRELGMSVEITEMDGVPSITRGAFPVGL